VSCGKAASRSLQILMGVSAWLMLQRHCAPRRSSVSGCPKVLCETHLIGSGVAEGRVTGHVKSLPRLHHFIDEQCGKPHKQES
jgi:hypothetical protein